MKIFYRYLCVVLVSLVVACGGGGGSPGEGSGTLPLKVDVPAGEGTFDNPVRIKANQGRLFKITGGRTKGGASGTEKRSYLVNVEETGVVGLSWAKTGDTEAEDLFVVSWISGPKQTKVTVRDADDKAVSFYVKTDPPEPVNLYTTAPDVLTIGVGTDAARTFDIGGGSAPYTVNVANTNVARVELLPNGKQWKIIGVAIGETQVIIRDATGAENGVKGIAINVGAPELRISPETLLMPVGIEGIAKISGGQPPYKVAGGIPSAISARVVGDELKIVGSLASKLDVTVEDATGQTVKVEVEINVSTTSIRFSPSALAVSENDTQPIDFTVFGAVGEFCIFTSDPTYLRPDGSVCRTNTNVRLITGTAGTRCVTGDKVVTLTVVDSMRSTGIAQITIKDNGPGCGTAGLALTPNAVSVNVEVGTNEATSNNVVITGGSGSYVVTSSNPQLATATVAGNVLTIKGGVVAAPLGAPVDVTVTVRDANNPSLNASVTVTVR